MKSINNKLSEMELLNITGAPGAQYIVADADKIIDECYAGLAERLSGEKVTEQTTFNAFSITKTATAAAILQLVERKKILLSDFVNPMLNEFHFRYPFTIQQLLAHQAGFGDPIPISWIHLADEEDQFNEQNFIRQTVDKNSNQKYIPGNKFSYSSIGYLILERIVEKVSGESYDSFVMKNVLPSFSGNARLSFRIENKATHATGYHDRLSMSNLILGFFLDRKKFIGSVDNKYISFRNFYVNGKGYGGLIGNAGGLIAYLQSYLKNEMFRDQDMMNQMFTEQKNGMALGWFTGKLNGQNYVCHAGGGGGYYCEIRIYPELKIASAMMRNKSSFGDLRLLDKIDSKVIF